MGNFSQARQAALLATQADPTYVKGWWRLGQALQHLEQPKEALEALEKAVLEEQERRDIETQELIRFAAAIARLSTRSARTSSTSGSRFRPGQTTAQCYDCGQTTSVARTYRGTTPRCFTCREGDSDDDRYYAYDDRDRYFDSDDDYYF